MNYESNKFIGICSAQLLIKKYSLPNDSRDFKIIAKKKANYLFDAISLGGNT